MKLLLQVWILTMLVEDDEDRCTYYFYVCFDEGGNQFSMSKYVKEGEQDEE